MIENFSITGHEYNLLKNTLNIYYKNNNINFNNKYLTIIIYDDFFNFICYKITAIINTGSEYWIGTSLLPFSKIARFEIYDNDKKIYSTKIFLNNSYDLNILNDAPFLLNYAKYNIDGSTFHDVFIKKEYDYPLKVEKNDVVLDIGSNIGAFICDAVNKLAAKIYSCEPSIHCYNILQDVFKYFPHVKLNNAAISDSTSLKFLMMLDDTNGGNFLSDNNNISWHDRNKKSQPIQAYTFLDFISKNEIKYIDFLKCDCEGGEHYIFVDENANFISKKIDKIVLEYHGNNKNILTFLKKNDFNILKLDGTDKIGIIHAKNNKSILKYE